MIDQLKDLKDTYENARQQIDRGKEPLEDLIKLQNFLNAICEDPSIIIEKVDKDYKRYFFDDFSMGLLKRLTRERSRDDKYLDVIGGILEAYVKIFISFLRLGQLNQQFFDSIKFLFEFDSILHNYNYQIPDDQLKNLRSANQEWRQDLKEGDMVDAIIDENNSRCSGWSQAKIASVSGDTLQLEFIYDVKTVDKFVDRWSVEVAPFESKTKEIWEWKSTLAVNQMVDAHDKTVWNKSTILDIKDHTITPNRIIKMAYIGYRIYVENGTKSDEKGQFDGWSNRFDEWVSIYSPRIQPFFSKTQKGTQDDLDLDEDFDNLIQPEEGFDKVFAVPRLRKCISSLFIHLINLFGNKGGFELILQSLSKQESDEENNMDLNILANLIHCVSYPYLIYHKDFIHEYGPRFVELCIKRLREAPEKSLRDVRREKIESIIKSIDNFQRRLIGKDEREKQTEILKLEVALMCLKSSFLERRIQGIRDLNQIIKNNRMFTNKNFTSQFLVEWMQNNGVFAILFDTKKTHLQLVQRCTDILKLLLQENMLTPQLMEMFWSLAKSDFKFEVYKIINESSFYLKQDHIDFFFQQIKQVPAEKLAIEEFQCLSELGKYAKDLQFKHQVTQFFWQIICNSEQYKEDLVNNCITKFCEMVKNWDVKTKHDFFLGLTKNLSENKSSIPSLKLFKGLLKDQKDRTSYTYNSSSPQKQSDNIEGTSDELNLSQSLDILLRDHNLVKILLENMRQYCQMAKAKVTDQSLTESRKKVFLVNPKYSHNEEIDERLQFLKYIASICSTYQISKVELDILYDLLVINSIVPSDQEEFLIWCKSSCEQNTATNQILDLNEVGEFFSEKMKTGALDVKNLIITGFDFLQQYFLSVNENSSKLLKSTKSTKQTKVSGYSYSSITYGFNTNGSYGPKAPTYYGGSNNKKQEEEDTITTFKLLKPPSELDQLEIVWNIALNCENAKVVPKAIDFLIKVYYSLDTDLDESRTKIQDELIEKCIQILKESQDEHIIKRVIEIVKNIIYEAEKKGTGDVKPHNALLKGELLERINVKNKASPKSQIIVMSIYSNTTFWEFKKEVAKQLELAPKYLKLEKLSGQAIKDIDNGKTLGELGFQSGEYITAYKINIEEEVPNAPLTTSEGKLTEKARQIFNEWFDLYSEENGQMTKETCALFIKGCTGEYPGVSDERITNLFKTYDTNQDGKIERAEFLTFYESAARSKPETVRENLRAHNIRNDLKKLSEVTEESSFGLEDMPRYKISKNQEYFDLLMSLLDKRGQISDASWNLIQMLATNQELYTRVLQLKTALDPTTGKIDWAKFFDNNSVYKLLYTLQIVEAVMEEGEGEGLERIVVVDEQEASKKKVPMAPPLPGAVGPEPPSQIPGETPKAEEEIQPPQPLQKVESSSIQLGKTQSILEADEDKKLRSEWTQMFLEHKGFQYILKVFMEKQIDNVDSSHSEFELKHIAFLLKLLRIFIMAAFSTSAEAQVYAGASLVRRSSSSYQEEETEKTIAQEVGQEGSRFKELQKLLAGYIGEKIIEQIDYKEIQKKLLNIISQVLAKNKMIFEDKLIVENALSLWLGCILHKNELLNDFYQFQSENIQSCENFILQGLLFCNYEKVREEFKQSFACLSHKLLQADKVKELPLFYLLRLLSEKFSLISQYHCKQYFELFCDLIDQYFMVKHLSQSESQVFNPEHLLALIIDKIKEFNQLASTQNTNITDDKKTGDEEEKNDSASEQENIYIGLIQLTEKIIDNFDISFSEKIVESKNLIDEIFVKFLFASVFKQEGKTDLNNLKIKPTRGQRQETKKQQFGKKSKDAAYKLLNSLIRKSPLLMNAFLEKSMLPLMQLIKKHDGWNYTPPGHSENRQKYVGLKNLGCICYMNSMLQQFFMIPAFRYNLLSVDDKIPEDIQEFKGHKVDDNVLHQLQKLMAHLELSERQDYNPFEFCFAFKDLDGNPTNTGEQKDAQEFLNLSFDRIENLLRGTTRKYLLQSVFGGQTCSQLVCQECGKVKNRIEDFYNLSLTVKDIKSMYDSLQKLIEGEVINDFECDQCKKKVDISKRTLISQTPNVLIVHLQRITFNFETFRNDKINSFFEFPQLLDLKPYSFFEVMKKENRLKQKGEDEEEQVEQKVDEDNQWPEEEDCFEYKLVGVTVHSGTANAGHYWSYINTKRGYLEPNDTDPNWQKTENDPWMEFNDSTVRDFNFEKLKEECYGGDGKGGSDDAWSFGGSYGKSAYMLVYERRKKRPIKILADPEEPKENMTYDAKKEEHYKLVDYRECYEDIAPNQIYRQVFEDNQKFEFENDIYSSEFFDFIKGILQAVLQLDKDRKNHGQLLTEVKKKSLGVAKKTILDLLAKCFYNTSIKYLVESLMDIMKNDDQLCALFLEQCFQDDNCNYLLEILLECTDSTARLHVGNLLKFILNTLKMSEKDYLYETEKVTVNTENGEVTYEQPKALSARFIKKCLSILNTQVAKNWARFENFLELLYYFAIGKEPSGRVAQNGEAQQPSEEELIGLEFFYRSHFIEKACDFLLGKKSPLSTPGEKRFEMGGSFNSPNFSPIIQLVTKMITYTDLLEKYPLTETEKQLFLHPDLLKIMLGASQGSKQFGHCLANMCKDNIKLSQKVSKVFIKAINGSNFDNAKSYLTALKPFLKINDSLKLQKLEWVFGFSQIIQRKSYREEKYKYGLEFVDRINEESNTYVSPITQSSNDESLFSQLLKCKGKLDTFAINCLQEMLSLMAKDDKIARFVYQSAPPTYQNARYSDWIRPYLEYQKSEVERANSYAYFKNKHDAILKSLVYLEKFEEKCKEFAQQEKSAYEKAKNDGQLEEVSQDWFAYQNPEIIEHFPPQLIIGKQTNDDKEFLIYDEDPLVRVTIYEVPCEYNYSNPTGWFNLSLPHIEVKTNNYQTMSYAYYKKAKAEQDRKQAEYERQQQQQEDSTVDTQKSSDDNAEVKDPQSSQEQAPVEEPEFIVRNWFDNKKEGFVLLKVLVTNKEKKRVSVKVRFHIEDNDGAQPNVILPVSHFKETFFDADTKYICHLMKVDPTQGWGNLKVSVEAKEYQIGVPKAPGVGGKGGISNLSVTVGTGFQGAATFVSCGSCKKMNDVDQEFCEACGESLGDLSTNVMESYFGSIDQGTNQLY